MYTVRLQSSPAVMVDSGSLPGLDFACKLHGERGRVGTLSREPRLREIQ
jgi:hypothetical protein